MNKRIQGIAGLLVATLALLSSACTVSGGQQGDPAARAAAMDADIDRALSQLAQQTSGSEQLVSSAKGVLVFPSVLSAGLGIGGSHGLGGLRKDGKDRPLHYEGWKTASEALGPIPYVKGALFLDRLRSELGETAFWRGIARYTRSNARALVDSRDFQRAMEQASGRPLAPLFDDAVYR